MANPAPTFSLQRIIFLAVSLVLCIQVGWWINVQIRESGRLLQARTEALNASLAEAWQMDSLSMLAFIHASGTIERRDLQPGQTLFVDTGCLVGYTPTVDFEVQYVGKIKTALFGGEGLFFAKVTGPGTVWLQSLPFSRLASRVFAAAPQRGGSREEGSVLGGFAGGGLLGSILGGDDE